MFGTSEAWSKSWSSKRASVLYWRLSDLSMIYTILKNFIIRQINLYSLSLCPKVGNHSTTKKKDFWWLIFLSNFWSQKSLNLKEKNTWCRKKSSENLNSQQAWQYPNLFIFLISWIIKFCKYWITQKGERTEKSLQKSHQF